MLRPIHFSMVVRLAAVLISMVFIAGSGQAEERPNVLWITAEDMSATLGCWGDSYATTPNIDALAQESVIYTNAFATAPVCSPARSCLITGCYATSLGTQRLRSEFPIPKSIHGFPSLMRAAGYYCTNNVKTDYNTSREKSLIKESWDESSAKAIWRGRGGEQPFFGVFNHMTSHQSRTMVMAHEDFVSNVQSRLDPSKIHDPAQAPVPPYYPDTEEIRRGVARYYDCVSVMDQEVGELLRQLEDDGLADDTIVFFFSDHGSGMPRHKRALLDSGLHVPLLIRFPPKYQHLAPANPGSQLDRLVSFVDFPCTLLNLLGLEIPEHMQGQPFLGNGSDETRQFVYAARDRVDEAFDLARSIRDKRYLYIRNFMPGLSYHQPSFYADQGTIRAEISRYAADYPDRLTPAQAHYVSPTRAVEELYDVVEDPWNQQNLADSADHQDVLQRMRQALTEWIVDIRDVGFLPEEEVWARIRRGSAKTPYDLRQQPQDYPLQDLLQAASQVGTGVDSLAEIRRGIQSTEPGIRYWAAIAIGTLGTDAAAASDDLLTLLEDSSVAVRIEAAYALAKMDRYDVALPALIKELDSDNIDAVLHAARAVELLGGRARQAAGAMQRARDRYQQEGTIEMFIQFAVDAYFRELQ